MAIPSNIVMAVVIAIAMLVGFHCALNNFPSVRRLAIRFGRYVDVGISVMYWMLSAGGSQSGQLTSALIGLGIYFYLGSQREKAKAADGPDQRDVLLQALTKEVADLSEKVREQSHHIQHQHFRWK
tara:strand:- start:570 stop:947 length:378 start_codon:yes stop_codon:yes gene_type:complete